eukprot:6925378-Alexandrium_andersonii.AAC.1
MSTSMIVPMYTTMSMARAGLALAHGRAGECGHPVECCFPQTEHVRTFAARLCTCAYLCSCPCLCLCQCFCARRCAYLSGTVHCE